VSDLKARGGESASIRPFSIGGLTVQPEDGTISGPAGQVRIDPQVMAVLVLLRQSTGKVVSREDLLERVWPGRVVGDDALSRCVYQLRRHMSQAGGSRNYRSLIETLPKRGYRLNGDQPVVNARYSKATRAAPWVVALLMIAAILMVVGGKTWVGERPAEDTPATTDRRALDAYLRANEYFSRADHRTAVPYAVELYEQATELDPGFVSAWAGLARAHTDMYWHGIDRTPVRLDKAENAIRRLAALDADSPETQLAKANYLLKGLNRYQEALEQLDMAERSIPRERELFFLRAMAHRRLGDWATAVEELDKALELDPDNITYLRQQMINYQFLREYEHADQLLDRILDVYPDDGTAYVDRVALALLRDGDTAPFHSYQQSAPSQYYDDGSAYTYTSWLAAVFDRDYETALSILDSTTDSQIFDGDFRNAPFGPKVLFYARTHALAGNAAQAREEYATVVRLLEELSVESADADDHTAASRYLALAEAQAGLGEREAAMESVRHAAALLPEGSDALMGPALLLNSAIRVFAPAGYDQAALAVLGTYLSHEGHWSIEGLRKDPRLESLSRNPGFKELEKQYARL